MEDIVVGGSVKRGREQGEGRGCLEIIEEAVHVLRTAPVGILAAYYIGSFPFIMALLYFWADMSRSAFAYHHCAEASLGLSLLFVWMKCWQTVFARRLKAWVCGDTAWRSTPRRVAHLIATQAFIQPSSLFTLPLAGLLAVPLGWVYAFYHNVSVLGDGGSGNYDVLSRSWRQARLWPKQNHLVMFILSAFGLFVFLNIVAAALILPHLVKMFTGSESVFTRSLFHVLNTTFLAAVCGICYLCMNPLIKTVYVLRCFYGESLRTGEDLRVELRGLGAAGKVLAAVLIALLCVSSAKGVDGAPRTRHETKGTIRPEELDESIEEVMTSPRYSWRMPREKAAREARKSWLAGFLDGVAETIGHYLKKTYEWARNLVERIIEWLEKWFFPRRSYERGRRRFSIGGIHGLLLILIAAVSCCLAIMYWRERKRRRALLETESEPMAPVPDITDEDVGPGELPVDGWLSMARELIEKGELRLAMRALYLATLAHLAAMNIIIIAKFKTNRDYEDELRRRAHAHPDLVSTFTQNMTVFERIWYGMHEITGDIVDGFTRNYERMSVFGKE